MWYLGLDPGTAKNISGKIAEIQIKCIALVTSNVPILVSWFWKMHDGKVRC